MRTDVTIPSGNDTLAAWLYLPERHNGRKPPVIVMAHGLGAVKEMRLDAYAERFVAAGYACLVFDYRHFGGSTGEPRQLLDIGRQLEDWEAAIAWARGCHDVDGSRVVLWGTSFGGGHAIWMAAEDGNVAAAIAQCPFTDGLASLRTLNPVSAAKVSALALRDLAADVVGKDPVYVASAGPARSASLMNAWDCEPGYLALTPQARTFQNKVAARFALQIARHAPGRRAKEIKAPIYFALCRKDTVAPATVSERHAEKAPHGEIKVYPFGHFDIYLGEGFEQAVTDYLDFLRRHVPVAA
ncbi:MAG TPA: alpha/beta fold hydrolase [Aeromicrobium sp.]|nr:alpha/beta fold hydrolase [Aeromicrobium sp.]HKY57316.1 alpha/beta fold hydrolase [Aeromicrobium sp.]